MPEAREHYTSREVLNIRTGEWENSTSFSRRNSREGHWTTMEREPAACRSCLMAQRTELSEGTAYRCAIGNVMGECEETVEPTPDRGEEARKVHCEGCIHSERVISEASFFQVHQGRCHSCRRLNENLGRACGLDGRGCSLFAVPKNFHNNPEIWGLPIKTWHEMNYEEKVQEAIVKYDKIRKEYSNTDVAKELIAARDKRTEMWEKVNAYEGMIVSDKPTLPEPMVEALPSLVGLVRSDLVGVSIGREKRKQILPNEFWRLSFNPGAMISAAESEENNNPCACLGRNAQFEGTAVQVALDPHLAVLERIAKDGERRTGFQFVILGTTGIHAYGGKYDGSYVGGAEAAELVITFANQLFPMRQENAEEYNKAADALCEILEQTVGEKIDPKTLYIQECEEEEPIRFVTNIGRAVPIHEAWEPIQDVTLAYNDARLWGVKFPREKRDLLPQTLADRLAADGINKLIEENYLTGRTYICQYCGEEIADRYHPVVFEEGHEGFGWEPGTAFCGNNCAQEAALRIADSYKLGVYLVNGELVTL